MDFWMNLKVKTKSLCLVAIAVVTLIAIAGASLHKMRIMSDDQEAMNTSVIHVGMLNDMKNDLLAIRLDLVYMMLLEDPALIKDKADDLEKRKKQIAETQAKFLKYDLDQNEKRLIGTFKQGYEEYLVQGAKLQQMTQQSVGNAEARKETVAFATSSVAPLYKKPADAISDLVADNLKSAGELYQQDLAAYHSSQVFMIVLSALAALFMGVMGLLIANSISRPLKMVFDTLAEVAAGDLTARSSIRTRDEMGMLAAEVNEMAEKLNQTLSQVAANSQQVASAANDLHSTSEQIATGAEEVASQTGTVATASEEMAATSADIAQSCHRAASGGEQATGRAQAGRAVVEQTVQVMSRIADQVKTSAATVAGLGERSDQIGAIIGTIEDIADQTNLLALNAAIEAARAGEQGRGFAVVADEVRALAERTTRATREIGEMIKSIQSETRDAVGAMEEGVREVENGTREAAKSGESLQEILRQISEVTEQVNQIATAAEEQTATTGEITNNIMQITEVVQDTSRGAHTCANAASNLAALSQDLQRLVGQFKLA
ncbi:methyl-accepting chemotaxis protein [Geomonas sp. Red69]|uniref:Methyl-accepting chemotaxis protein n=1 Tax=Geomonas diazotrophica TaxID=2843197 RepID=A0ABX8JF99_9BACT|nr:MULTISPECIES: methyl-accepting chemotaxis protein [Geomonas]MBU5637368.1 methyl-accepting chemotaxis protein [Geomonas diazotrophica]QWV95806.1 methyl-accepting chemotaxis protein [Geomonas nitrogeniifigens]QXE84878.1 methyl-accepting chemotaxis protein [Geomonas nitrogeniifigens]